MIACLRGERKIDGYWEKTLDWELYNKLILSTWVKIFEPDNAVAVDFAKHWANIIEKIFASGVYDDEAYQKAYMEEFYQNTNGYGAIHFVTFYLMNLLQGLLSEETESRLLDYVINYETGICYI